jgi:hypothetical protein
MNYEFDVLIGVGDVKSENGLVWKRLGDFKPRESLGSDITVILNELGREGWKVVAKGPLGIPKLRDLKPVAVELMIMRTVSASVNRGEIASATDSLQTRAVRN